MYECSVLCGKAIIIRFYLEEENKKGAKTLAISHCIV